MKSKLILLVALSLFGVGCATHSSDLHRDKMLHIACSGEFSPEGVCIPAKNPTPSRYRFKKDAQGKVVVYDVTTGKIVSTNVLPITFAK